MKEIDFGKVELKEDSSLTETFDNKELQITTDFSIMYEDKKIGEVGTLESSLNMKYVEYIEVDKDYRNKGIATHILTEYFRGYFISAGNLRVTSLYNRIGRDQTKFTDAECRTLAYNTGMYGTFIIE